MPSGRRLPVVLTRPEVQALLAALDGVSWIMALVLYGSGLRPMECLRLRAKDIDFTRNEMLVREGKGNKDRVTMLAAAVKAPLLKHLEQVRRLHARDLKAGFGRMQLPHALARKYPNADREGVAMGVPGYADLYRSAFRRPAAVSLARVRPAARHSRSGAPSRSGQTRTAAGMVCTAPPTVC